MSDSIAVVVTRPPETWAILRDPKAGKVCLRDSHRLEQYDFASMDCFCRWLGETKYFFCPVERAPPEQNLVSLCALEHTDEPESHAQARMLMRGPLAGSDIPFERIVRAVEESRSVEEAAMTLLDQD